MRFILTIIFVLATLPASAQVRQSGNVTPTHAACWTTNGVVQDCGTAAVPYLTTLGINGQLCVNSGVINGPYNALCLLPTSSGGGFTWTNYGGASGVPSFNINGTVYPFPFTLSGGVVGPSTTTVGCAAPWANTTGTLLGNNCALSISGSVVTLGGTWANATATETALPPVATGIMSGLCDGGVGDAAALNTLLGANVGLGVPANTTCKLSAALAFSGTGNFAYSQFLGAGISTALEPSGSTTQLINIAPTGGSYADISHFGLANQSSYATDGVVYNSTVSNGQVKIHDNGFFTFTNAILDNSTSPGGDDLNVFGNFFQNNSGWAVDFANYGIDSSVHSNYVLGGPGFNFAKVGAQNEGTRIYDNTVLASAASASSVNISAGLEFEIFGNIFDQNYAHGVILNASSNAISGIKFVSNWIGASASVAATQDGVHMSGTPEYLPMIADTFVGWSNYGVNTGSGGVQHLPIIGSKFYNNTAGDLYMNNVAGAVLVGNVFASTGSINAWTEASMGGPLMAFGNTCAEAATGIQTTDLILGDGTCAPNQIPAPITFNSTTSNPVIFASSGNNNIPVRAASGDEAIFTFQPNGLTTNGWQLGSNGSNHFFAYDTANSALVWQMTSGVIFAFTPTISLPNVIATAAAPTVSASQVGFGGSVEAAGSGTCPSGTVGGQTVAGCLIVNVAGTAHYAPYF